MTTESPVADHDHRRPQATQAPAERSARTRSGAHDIGAESPHLVRARLAAARARKQAERVRAWKKRQAETFERLGLGLDDPDDPPKPAPEEAAREGAADPPDAGEPDHWPGRRLLERGRGPTRPTRPPTFERTKAALAETARENAFDSWDCMLLPDVPPRRSAWRVWMEKIRSRAAPAPSAPRAALPPPATFRTVPAEPERASREPARADPEPVRAAAPPARTGHRFRPFRSSGARTRPLPPVEAATVLESYFRRMRESIRALPGSRREEPRTSRPALPPPRPERLRCPLQDEPWRHQLPVPTSRSTALVPAAASFPALLHDLQVRGRPVRAGALHVLMIVLISLLLVIGVPLMLIERQSSSTERVQGAVEIFASKMPADVQRRLEVVVPLDQPEADPAAAPEWTPVATGAVAVAPDRDVAGEAPAPLGGAPPREPASGGGPPQVAGSSAGGASTQRLAAGVAALDQGASEPDQPAADQVPGGASWSELYELGHELRAAGRAEDAVAALEGAAQLNPSHPAIHYDLGYLLQRMGHAAGAVRHYRKAIELRPEHAFALYNLGFLLDQAGEDRSAVALYERAVELLPENPYVAFNFAKLLERQGEVERAKAMYRRAAEAGPDAQIGRDAEARLGQLLRASS